jgi:hypothetical protein
MGCCEIEGVVVEKDQELSMFGGTVEHFSVEPFGHLL